MINKVKVGDKVISTCSGELRFEEVVRLTKTQVHTVYSKRFNHKYNKKTGREVGYSDGFHVRYIRIPTKEDRESIQRNIDIGIVKDIINNLDGNNISGVMYRCLLAVIECRNKE